MTTYRERDSAARAILSGDDSALASLLIEHGDAHEVLVASVPTSDLEDAVRDVIDDLPLFQCGCCDCETHEDDGRSVGDSSWCDDCVESSAYYWESDDCYHDEPEPDEDEGSYGGYHGERRRQAAPGDIGIEVELQFHDEPYDVSSHANDAGIMVEEDSSLNYSNSGEAITHPFTPNRKGMQELGGLTEFLGAVRASAWSNTGYGIHINVDRRGLSRFTLARVERFMGANVADVYRVAGRESSQWSPMLNRRTRDLGSTTGKYAALRIASDRVEFRVFQSNARAKGVRHCARFSLDLIEFCRDAGWSRLNWSTFCESYPQWAEFRMANDEAVAV